MTTAIGTMSVAIFMVGVRAPAAWTDGGQAIAPATEHDLVNLIIALSVTEEADVSVVPGTPDSEDD